MLLMIPPARPGSAPEGFNRRELGNANGEGYCSAGDMIYSIGA
jgi:hypothetical protein